MLQAILHGKAGRVEAGAGESQRWADVFQAREDLMTAAVFGRFAYLSSPVHSHLVRQWLGVTEPLFDDYESADFWPSYYVEQQHESEPHSQRVEPDLVLKFGSANVIIEVKPPAGGDQYFEQWHREVASFAQSGEGADIPLFFLAIGRVPAGKVAAQWQASLKEEFANELTGINAIEWQPLVNTLLELEKSELPNTQDRRVITDMLQAARLYGLKTSVYSWQSLLSAQLPSITLNHPALKPQTTNRWDALLTHSQASQFSLGDIQQWKK